MKRLPLALFALLAVLPLGPVPAASASSAPPPPVSFTADPAPGASTSPTGGWFLVQAQPGSTTRQALTLRNTSTQPTELVLSPVDASTSAVGGASYALPDEPVTATGTWVEPGRERITLAPGQTVDVPFTITVPRTAPPGDHLAGLSVTAPRDVSTGAARAQAAGPSTSLDLRTRRVLAVQVAVPGPAQPRIDVQGLTTTVTPTGARLALALSNSGRRLTRGTGVLTLAATGVRTPFSFDTFVPGTSIAYPLPWPDGTVPGRHEAQVELAYDGRTTQWSGQFEVADDEAAAAARDEQAVQATAPTPPPAPGPPRALLVGAVVGGIVVALAGQAAVRRLRRPAPAGPA